LFKKFFSFIGITEWKGFLKDKQFYFALLLGPIFCIFLSLFIKTYISFKKPIFFFNQFFFVAFPEEFFFRGFLLPSIKIYIPFKWNGISLANIITAIVFAFFHLFMHSPFWAMSTLFPAVVFGYFRERHNSLWPAVMLHFFYNCSYFVLCS